MTDHSLAGELSARARVISGLREAADYLDRHPGVPVSEHARHARSRCPGGADL